MKDRLGAYVLCLDLKLPLALEVGSLGMVFFPAGCYAYVGSAHGRIVARVARHKRLAVQKSGKLHWHIDYILLHAHTRWVGEVILDNGIECEISKRLAAAGGVTAPVPGFGSSDCRAGCIAHLYLLPSDNPGGLLNEL